MFPPKIFPRERAASRGERFSTYGRKTNETAATPARSPWRTTPTIKPQSRKFDARRSLRATAAIALALGLAACGPNPIPIDMKDDSADIFSARLLWRPDTSSWQPGASATGYSRTNTPGIEFQYLRSSGEGTQQIGSNDFISNGNSSISGPQEVRHHADLHYMHAVYNNVTRYSEGISGLELEWFAGLGSVDASLRSTPAGPGTTMNTSSSVSGIAGGVGPRWNFNGRFAIEGRLAAVAVPFSSEGFFENTELALRYRPFPYFALRGGYAWLRYHAYNENSSDVEIALRGPFLGLNFFF